LKVPTSALLEKLLLIDRSHLKRAAVLLFHPDPERFATGTFVKIGFFRTDADLLYHDEIHGDLFAQVEKTMDLLRTKYLKAGISYRGIQRVETLAVPEAALREAVLNAIIHKDNASGTPIQISVYSTKLMIWNPGELPAHWTVANLKEKHPSRPFNPDVANTFFRAGMIEAWGRGIERMMDACRAAKVPEPILRSEPFGIWVEFSFPARTTQETTLETTQETTQERILAELKKTPTLTRRQLADVIGLTADGIKYHLNKLRSKGTIRHIGPTKAGHWEISERK
jgi:ATP-dependent DNA helicase RecG